ncbi:MAG: formate dehydrogenase accessory sulfurtransferase FdhD [Woeseiaceae bacterium]|nr:formate dehydrogenase accessory sulfurtransferase FdhD [Woeseiaceae bacterium]
MTGASTAIEISSVQGASEARDTDAVAVEEPLEIQLCSATATGAAARSISITMRTPGDDADLALGFLYTEGIIHSHSDIIAAAATGEVDARTGLQNRMLIELDPSVAIDLERLQRHFYTTSSCGVCGKASIDALRVVGRNRPAAASASRARCWRGYRTACGNGSACSMTHGRAACRRRVRCRGQDRHRPRGCRAP